MWPQALQMTRDECRGALRRLELESYSHVISVFRAQGGLSDGKAKLLEELRGAFHISQERHRAEARRVANDEELSTIAEAISGPNTWQEWSREGRRSFPMLPRVAPQTALALIANNVASETAAENAKLLYPADTASVVLEDHAALAAARESAGKLMERANYVVTTDPFKIPDIPAAPKKNLKRNITDHSPATNKKRTSSEPSPLKLHQQQKPYQQMSPNISVFTSPQSNIKRLYNSQTKLTPQKPNQQQVQKPKMPNKRAAAAANKKQINATKSGRKAPKVQEPQLPKSQIQQQQQQQMEQPSGVQQQQQHEMMEQTPITASSKKDITRNLTKLQVPGIIAAPEHQQHVTVSTAVPPGKTEKNLISTPVQKYIVEDRQPPTLVQPLTLPPAQQVMTLPQLSAAATKLRAVNTTILPPGTKIMAKKLPSSTMVTASPPLVGATAGGTLYEPQVYNIIDGTTITTSATELPQALPIAPTHTPPAVIQLHSSHNELTQPPTQGKVLTTKLLPLVLGTGGVAAGGLNSPTITKIETLNNGQPLATAAMGSSGALGSPVGSNAIIKNIQPAVMISGQGGNSAANTYITAMGAGTPVFRKHTPNIIKGVSTTKTPLKHNSGGPQIISNIKLSPAITTTPIPTSTPQQMLQHQLKNVTAGGIRANVKICQSPNGKMFLQSTGVDGSKAKMQHKLLSSTIIGGTSSTTISNTSAPQRITIQKVQIIPAPMQGSNPVGTTTLQLGQQQKSSKLTIGNKSNMVFIPSANMRATTAAQLAKSNVVIKEQKHSGDMNKPNLVVIGGSASTSGSLKPVTLMNNNKIITTSVHAAANQMITEDTPVDILNMPIIVEDSDGVTPTANVASNNIGDTVTVLGGNVLEKSAAQSQQQQASVVLAATDWEMELDQAAATKRGTPPILITKQSKFIDQTSQKAQEQMDTIELDDSFEDVIVEDQSEAGEEPVDATNAAQTTRVNEAPKRQEAKCVKTTAVEKQAMHPPHETEADAGFDETIADYTDVDENTAMEYVEDDFSRISKEKTEANLETSEEHGASVNETAANKARPSIAAMAISESCHSAATATASVNINLSTAHEAREVALATTQATVSTQDAQ